MPRNNNKPKNKEKPFHLLSAEITKCKNSHDNLQFQCPNKDNGWKVKENYSNTLAKYERKYHIEFGNINLLKTRKYLQQT